MSGRDTARGIDDERSAYPSLKPFARCARSSIAVQSTPRLRLALVQSALKVGLAKVSSVSMEDLKMRSCSSVKIIDVDPPSSIQFLVDSPTLNQWSIVLIRSISACGSTGTAC